MEGTWGVLYSKATDVNVNHSHKIPSQQHRHWHLTNRLGHCSVAKMIHRINQTRIQGGYIQIQPSRLLGRHSCQDRRFKYVFH